MTDGTRSLSRTNRLWLYPFLFAICGYVVETTHSPSLAKALAVLFLVLTLFLYVKNLSSWWILTFSLTLLQLSFVYRISQDGVMNPYLTALSFLALLIAVVVPNRLGRNRLVRNKAEYCDGDRI